MAIDTMKGTEQDNPLRTAMSRAGSTTRRALDGLMRGNRTGEPFALEEAPDRRRLGRADVKVAFLGYIDAHFHNRTTRDGTILNVSRELLVEDLTSIIMEMEDRLFEGAGPAPAAVAPKSQSYGAPPETNNE